MYQHERYERCPSVELMHRNLQIISTRSGCRKNQEIDFVVVLGRECLVSREVVISVCNAAAAGCDLHGLISIPGLVTTP